MIVVVENDKQLAKLATVALTVGLIDQDEALIVEVRWQGGGSLNKVESAWARVGGLGWGEDDHGWSRVMTTHLEAAPGIRSLVVGTELTHDGKANAGIQSQHDSEANTFQTRGQPNGVVLAEEP